MKSSLTLWCAVGAALLIMGVGTIAADRDLMVSTKLIPYNETPATINSTGSGEFRARISGNGTTIDYERDLPGSVVHRNSITHSFRPLTGGVVLFLC